jgi:hypothetical protein
MPAARWSKVTTSARAVALEDRHDDARQITDGTSAGAAMQIDQRVGGRALRMGLQHRKAKRDARAVRGIVFLRHIDAAANHGLALNLGRRERAGAGLDRHRVFDFRPTRGEDRE